MNMVLVVLASYTSAYSVQTMLERKHGVLSKIVRAPTDISGLGCSYCLEFERRYLNDALHLIKESSISVRGVYDSKTLRKINL